MNIVKHLILLMPLFFIASCGGGGEPAIPVYNISSTDSAIEFKNEVGIESDQEYSFTVTHDGENVAVGFHPDEDVPLWLVLSYSVIS